MKAILLNSSVFLFLSFVLSACGGGGDADSIQQGVFVDAPVEGIRFETPTQSGLTDANGTFSYTSGEVVEFFVGDVLLGSGSGAARVTPIDLVPGATDETNQQVTNILRFLQSLDEGSNLNDGIQISAATRTALANQTMDFSLTETAFESAFASINSAVLGNNINMVSVADAQAHLRDTLAVIDLPVGDGGLGRLNITGDSAAVALLGNTFDPDDVISDSVWLGEGTFFQFSLREFNAQVINVTLTFFGSGAPPFSVDCGTIVAGNSCSGIDMNLSTKSITFSDLELSASDGSVIIINGTLFWRQNHQ